MAEKLLTAADVAERLSIPERTVYAMLAKGGPLEALRISIGPRLVRVHQSELEKWLSTQGVPHVSR